MTRTTTTQTHAIGETTCDECEEEDDEQCLATEEGVDHTVSLVLSVGSVTCGVGEDDITRVVACVEACRELQIKHTFDSTVSVLARGAA